MKWRFFMCEPTTVYAGVTAAVALFGAKMQHDAAANMPKPQAPTPPPQAGKSPDLSQVRRAAVARMGAGNQSTLLTGPGGVAPSALTLGHNTLLGS